MFISNNQASSSDQLYDFSPAGGLGSYGGYGGYAVSLGLTQDD